MIEGSILNSNTLYYTKNGSGKVIKFNTGYILGAITPTEVLIAPEPTHTDNVWYAGGISRHIRDIAETQQDAERITYPNSHK